MIGEKYHYIHKKRTDTETESEINDTIETRESINIPVSIFHLFMCGIVKQCLASSILLHQSVL